MASSSMAGEAMEWLVMAGVMGLLAAVFLPVMAAETTVINTVNWTAGAGSTWELFPLIGAGVVFVALLVGAVGVFG